MLLLTRNLFNYYLKIQSFKRAIFYHCLRRAGFPSILRVFGEVTSMRQRTLCDARP